MHLFVHIKSLGSRRNKVDKKPIWLDPPPSTTAQLIADLVNSEIQAYENRPAPDDWLLYLTGDQMREKAVDGKIDFGVDYHGASGCAEAAIRNALQSFEDGIFRLFLNETEVGSLQSPLDLHDGDTLTFIRLALLAGRMW